MDSIRRPKGVGRICISTRSVVPNGSNSREPVSLPTSVKDVWAPVGTGASAVLANWRVLQMKPFKSV